MIRQQLPDFPRGPLRLLSAAKREFPALRVMPVRKMFKAALSREFVAVEAAKLPQKAGGSRPDCEALEIGKPAFKFLDAEKLAAKAVGEDQGGMSAAAAFSHACKDKTRRVHGGRAGGLFARLVGLRFAQRDPAIDGESL